MRKKEIKLIIKYALCVKNIKHSMITFHLKNGIGIVTPIICSEYLFSNHSIRINEELKENTFIERFIPYSEINMVVLS